MSVSVREAETTVLKRLKDAMGQFREAEKVSGEIFARTLNEASTFHHPRFTSLMEMAVRELWARGMFEDALSLTETALNTHRAILVREGFTEEANSLAPKP